MEGELLLLWKCTQCGFVHSKEKNTDCPQCGHPAAMLFSAGQEKIKPLVA